MWRKFWQSIHKLILPCLFAVCFSLWAPPAFADTYNCFCWYWTDIGTDTESQYCWPTNLASIVYCEDSCSNPHTIGDQIFKSCIYTDTLGSSNPTRCSHAEGGASYAETICDRYPRPDDSPEAAATTTTTTTTYEFVAPELVVQLDPDFEFSPILSENGVLKITYLGDYLQMLYNYFLGTMTVVAIIVVMYHGVMYLLAGSSGRTKNATSGIRKVVWGLALLFGAVSLLKLVNPELTLFRALELEEVTADALMPYGESEESVSGTTCTSFGIPSGSNINGNNVQVCDPMVKNIEEAAKDLQSQGYGMILTSGYRSVEKQIELIKKYCINPPGSTTCNAKEGSPSACPLKDMDPKNCPHTTGSAVDMWGAEINNGVVTQCIIQKECLKDLEDCFENPCQKALIDAMKAEGFCVLASEPWHFEQPSMSSSCH
ncbi:TPA: hypothetical protein DEP34_00450 [Candidatus Uhrbacteria bacterium]|uniref:D-alanyl-D-alanine carboxypeptidase-like core domain-containing protein n=2 Tax=Candidatus Uhriibacteriota TaxID=1752732 RepID=A0A0G1T759_9BACT|nr:MAG: hypothetical protein UX45_C0003G0059 [Candidatus Uhrbacteria bacterium GW2011_GWF2_46_218]KKU41230.1 MAG: hypothetical protein UX57_C0005G0060 [Candidatus Uhrbacteria bacterium GW2011_GWE2_46_68]HBK34079.1 hypothetical protein [Candidatus Uhrbacteria bacterium]HCB18843.1 hypothetical protein [Candidatus Uhrbacteria bacterium]